MTTEPSSRTKQRKSRAPRWNRQLHRWGSVLTAVPLLAVILSGILLQLKKDWTWVQPATARGTTAELVIDWDRILQGAMSVEEAQVSSWADIDRLDVRPSRGMLKVRTTSRWEVQLDAATGEVLQVAYRRSDLIESIHDGSFFGDRAKLWVFLPTAVVLLGLWITGAYLWWLPHLVRWRRKRDA